MDLKLEAFEMMLKSELSKNMEKVCCNGDFIQLKVVKFTIVCCFGVMACEACAAHKICVSSLNTATELQNFEPIKGKNFSNGKGKSLEEQYLLNLIDPIGCGSRI